MTGQYILSDYLNRDLAQVEWNKRMKVWERNTQVRKTSLKEETDDLKNTTAAERWAMMWQLALDAWAFKEETIAESRLQRNIVRVSKIQKVKK